MSPEIFKLRRHLDELVDSVRSQPRRDGFSRRNFLKGGALAGAAASALAGGTGLLSLPSSAEISSATSVPTFLNEVSIAELQQMMTNGSLTSVQLVTYYLVRIQKLDQSGPFVNSVIEVNPDAIAIARSLDEERRKGHVRGPLHGIPVLLKANIDTADKMQTTAGSYALVGTPAPMDATVAANLRLAGAVILGKTNLSEWANFRASYSSSGWSGIGGQCNNPYSINRNPCGSSSGSGAASAANFTAGSLGTETDGSIICPANNNGVVGIKPTVGLTSRAGVVPISEHQDSVGPHGRSVADAAAVLGAIASTVPDPRDPYTATNRDKVYSDYTQFLNENGLKGARIGVTRNGTTGFDPKVDAIYDTAVQAMKDAGAIIVDPADIPDINDIYAGPEFAVLLFDFKVDLEAYLKGRVGVPIKNLADAIAFNNTHANLELRFFDQLLFELSQAIDVTDPNIIAQQMADVETDHQLGGVLGIDAALQQFGVDALVAPSGAAAWTTDLVNGDHFLFGNTTPAAIAGYPMINVPMGTEFDLPVGISFIGTAFSEPTLIKLASGFEHVTKARRQPKFLGKLPFDSGNCNTGTGDSSQTTSTTIKSSSKPKVDIRKMRPKMM
ncbi:MAG TPA: amidase [Terriglobales bacterium]|nr:amidase [Terriglobales bacterium]